MHLLRIALANLNTTVGATRANVDRAVALSREADADGATLVVFPEQTIGGYAAEDLVQWRRFVDAQWASLARFAEETSTLSAAFAIGLTVGRASHLYNCAALVHGGRVHGLVPKEKLPTYDVFYEGRTLAHGAPGLHDEVKGIPFGDLIFDLEGIGLALEVCEDAWSPDGPLRRRTFAGAELVANLSASPFRLGICGTRREMLATRAADCQCTIAYANLVGANDGLVFDGGGYIVQNGRIPLDAVRFREGFTAANVDLARTRRLRAENSTWRADSALHEMAVRGVRRVEVPLARVKAPRAPLAYPVPANKSFFLPEPGERRSSRVDFCEELLDALALGVGDYFEKVGAFRTIGVALSGGRDSLLCLIVARRYVDRKYAALPAAGRSEKARTLLRAFFMPSPFSSAETRAAAEQAAKDLDVPLAVVPVDEAFVLELREVERMLQPGEALTALARQNIQARVRAQRMWTWANSAAGLFLQTSNMSEKAVGYTTIGGDMEGALSVIANVPKTVVNYVLDYLYETTKWEGIRLTLVKPPSAELAEDMEDERDLMPFPVLDACFALYAGEKMCTEEVQRVLVALFPLEEPARLVGFAEKFSRLFTSSIYKWVQTPLSLHVGTLDLDRERALQLPVVQKREWDGPEGA